MNDLQKAETEFKMGLIRILMNQAADKLKKHDEKMKEFVDKPATAGFVYLNPNDKMPTIEEIDNEEGQIPPVYLVLHAHPDDPDLLFVVPAFEKWDLEDELAAIPIPGTSLVAHFNAADWIERKEIESWHLCDVYEEWKWKKVYKQWRNMIFKHF